MLFRNNMFDMEWNKRRCELASSGMWQYSQNPFARLRTVSRSDASILGRLSKDLPRLKMASALSLTRVSANSRDMTAVTGSSIWSRIVEVLIMGV